jgi:hypothetical protein
MQLLRRSTPTERAVLARSLSQTVLDLARRGLRAAHPDASEDDLRVLFVEIHYGRDLADQIRTYLIHLETMIKVVVFVSKTRAYDRQVGDRVRRQTLQSDPAARSFFFAAPEDVVLAKLEWYRAGGQVSERQWSDIVGVLKGQGTALDTEYMRLWATVLGLVDLLSKALDEAGP